MSLYYRAAAQSAHRPTAPRYYIDNNPHYFAIAIRNAGIKFAGIVFITALSLFVLAHGPAAASHSAGQRLNLPPPAASGPPPGR